MVKKTKNFSDLALKIFKEHYDFLHEKELHKWNCDQCDNRYESREELEIHRLKHIQNVRNICNECGKEFESMEELFEHEYCYICEQCDNGYNSIEELEDHRRRRHTKFNWEEENSIKKRESRVEIEEIEEEVRKIVHDLPNQSADDSSYDDKSKTKTTKELKEINNTERKIVKGYETL